MAVKKRVASALCAVASVVGYVVGTYGEFIVAICNRIAQRLGQ